MEREIPWSTVFVGGKKIALYQLGQGYPVILLHGLVAKGAWSLKHLAQKLSEHFWVIGIHLPGYEESEEYKFRNYHQLGKLIMGVTKKLGIQGSFHLFGHSTGGTIALVIASEFPERITKLSLFEPPFTKQNVRFFWRLSALFASFPGFIWFLRQILPRTGISDFKGGKSGSLLALTRIGKILTKSEFTENCRIITNSDIPVLLAFGNTHGLFLSLHSMKGITEIMPHSQQIEIQGAGHTLKRESQEILAEHLISFFSDP